MAFSRSDEQELNETDLVARAKVDKSAFVELYEKHVDRVYTYVYYRVGDQARAEDIVSSTFLKALTHLDGFEPKRGGFCAWILRIARNLMVDMFRKENKTVSLDGATLRAAASPEREVIAAGESRRLRQLVDELSPAQREAIILKYSVGLGNQEIAATLGKSETAVSSLLHRALTNLREEVQHEHELQKR